MENLEQQKTAYNLLRKERIYKDKTLVTTYFQSNKKQVEKKSQPIDIDGIRYKLIKETGELDYYTKSEVLNSMNQSLKRTKILLNSLLEMNDFDWFCTLTFDKERIDRTNDEEVFNAYTKYINNLKKQFPLLRYVCVPERHKELVDIEHEYIADKGCIHFHLLIGGVTTKQLGLVNSGKVCCSWAWFKNKICSKEYYEKTKQDHLHELTDTDGLTVYNITTFPYGLTTATRIVSRERCNTYVKKYIDKALGTSTDIFKKRFYYSSNLEVPEEVDKLIGADFETPKTIVEMQLIKEDPHYQNAHYINFDKEHNILQYWEDNQLKQNIDSGLIPLSNLEIVQIEKDIGEIF